MPRRRSNPPEQPPANAAAGDTQPRQRDAARTKAALLQAALVEFAEKGLAGARVDEIATRAGVNKQLISYYFGGKAGLHQALSDQWQLQDEAIIDPSRPLEDVVAAFLEAVCHNPDRVRFSVRETIDQNPAEIAYEPDNSDLADLRRRQTAGEISDELDPAFVLLMLQSVVMSGTTFPAGTKRMLGLTPGSPEYITHMDEQLRRLIRRLANPPATN